MAVEVAPSVAFTQGDKSALTVTMASLVCSMSEMTPSVMMRRTWYCEPSVTWAAVLWGDKELDPSSTMGPKWHLGTAKGTESPSAHPATWLMTGAKLVGP